MNWGGGGGESLESKGYVIPSLYSAALILWFTLNKREERRGTWKQGLIWFNRRIKNDQKQEIRKIPCKFFWNSERAHQEEHLAICQQLAYLQSYVLWKFSAL